MSRRGGAILEGPGLREGEPLEPIDERDALQHIWARLVLPACAQLLDDAVDKQAVAELVRDKVPSALMTLHRPHE